MANTSKSPTQLDYEQALQGAYNDTDRSFTVAGFISAKVGHKIQVSYVDSTTEDYEFLDGSTSLYTIRLIYTDATKASIDSVERVA